MLCGVEAAASGAPAGLRYRLSGGAGAVGLHYLYSSTPAAAGRSAAPPAGHADTAQPVSDYRSLIDKVKANRILQ